MLTWQNEGIKNKSFNSVSWILYNHKSKIKGYATETTSSQSRGVYFSVNDFWRLRGKNEKLSITLFLSFSSFFPKKIIIFPNLRKETFKTFDAPRTQIQLVGNNRLSDGFKNEFLTLSLATWPSRTTRRFLSGTLLFLSSPIHNPLNFSSLVPLYITL